MLDEAAGDDDSEDNNDDDPGDHDKKTMDVRKVILLEHLQARVWILEYFCNLKTEQFCFIHIILSNTDLNSYSLILDNMN